MKVDFTFFNGFCTLEEIPNENRIEIYDERGSYLSYFNSKDISIEELADRIIKSRSIGQFLDIIGINTRVIAFNLEDLVDECFTDFDYITSMEDELLYKDILRDLKNMTPADFMDTHNIAKIGKYYIALGE